MSGNKFGNLFQLTSFGESHGPAIGGVIDGCPSGIVLDGFVDPQFIERRRITRNSIRYRGHTKRFRSQKTRSIGHSNPKKGS